MRAGSPWLPFAVFYSRSYNPTGVSYKVVHIKGVAEGIKKWCGDFIKGVKFRRSNK